METKRIKNKGYIQKKPNFIWKFRKKNLYLHSNIIMNANKKLSSVNETKV